MKYPLYYYEDNIRNDLEELETYIAENEVYAGEEGLMNIFENEIGIIEDEIELAYYCLEYGKDMEEILNGN